MGKAGGQKCALHNLKGETICRMVDRNKGKKKKETSAVPLRIIHGSPLERRTQCVCLTSHKIKLLQAQLGPRSHPEGKDP